MCGSSSNLCSNLNSDPLVFNFVTVELKQGNNVVALKCPVEVFKSSLLDVFLRSDIEVSFKGRFDYVLKK